MPPHACVLPPGAPFFLFSSRGTAVAHCAGQRMACGARAGRPPSPFLPLPSPVCPPPTRTVFGGHGSIDSGRLPLPTPCWRLLVAWPGWQQRPVEADGPHCPVSFPATPSTSVQLGHPPAAKEGGAERPACWSGAHWVAGVLAKRRRLPLTRARSRGLKQTGHSLRDGSARGVGIGAADALIIWALRKKKAGKEKDTRLVPATSTYVHEEKKTVASSWDDPQPGGQPPHLAGYSRYVPSGTAIVPRTASPSQTRQAASFTRLPPRTLRRAPRLPPHCSPHLKSHRGRCGSK